MRELGMTLPGFQQRAAAIAELPALGLLTLAGMLPESWTSSYHGAQTADDDFVEEIVSEQPDLVAVSVLTASVEETAFAGCWERTWTSESEAVPTGSSDNRSNRWPC